MKKIGLTLVCLFTFASSLRAQQAGSIGAGVVAGNPTGVTGKMWIDGRQAFDVGMGYSTRFTVYGDYLWHDWKILPQPTQGRLPLYLGLGAQVRTFDDAEFGIRAVAGVAYWLPHDPVEIFVEIVPVFRVEPDSSVGLDGGVGVRYYFNL